MPAGVPVATMAVGKAGAQNAAIFAAQILALSDPRLQEVLVQHKQDLERQVARQAEQIPARNSRAKTKFLPAPRGGGRYMIVTTMVDLSR